MIDDLARRFHLLFSGLEHAHGTYNNITQEREDGKKTGDPLTKRQPVTDALWKAHLEGKNGIGIIPIRDDGAVLFGAIDVDVYEDLDPAAIAARLVKLGLPLIPCRSKSGGVHIYLFTKDPIPAGKVQERLRDIAARMGHGNSEIFPKQTRTSEKDLGSWINMPYFGGDETNRYGVKANGDPYSMEDFLRAADALKVDLEFFDVKKAKEPKEDGSSVKGSRLLPEGPPCLQHLVELGMPEGTRNKGLFNLGTYYRKARPADWKQCIEDANQKFLGEPLPSDEVQTIISSLDRSKEYRYQCSQHPLVGYCNSVVCRSRKYGIGGADSAFPPLTQLRKLMTVPPVWFLDVQTRNGDVVSLEMATDELQDSRAFQRLCMDRLDLLPQMPKKDQWEKIINLLLENVQHLDPPPADATPEGQFWELVESFCTGRAQAQSKEEILLGKPWTIEGRTYFRTQDLMKHLGAKQFKDFKVQHVAKMLRTVKDVDVQNHFMKIKGRGVNLWSLPEYRRDEAPMPIADAVDKGKGLF